MMAILLTGFVLWVWDAGRAGEEVSKKKEPEGRVVTLQEFIQKASENDTEFERILIEELFLKYREDIRLPARDLVMSVKGQYDFMLDQERTEPDYSVSLSKLFPLSGSLIEAEYDRTPSYTSTQNSSGATVTFSQPIAQNAFGRSTRMLKKIVGLEVEVAEYQIVEAYEDYLAAILGLYYGWYEAYENLKVGESSFRENSKLLDNMRERQKSKIAYAVDVNKTELLVLGKKEKLVDLQEKYESALNRVRTAMRCEAEERLIPENPQGYDQEAMTFHSDFEALKSTGRTFRVLSLLEQKTALDVSRSADDLLPSIDLQFGYNIEADHYRYRDSENMLFMGVRLDYPFFDQVDRAEYQTAKIEHDKSRLNTENVYFRLMTDLQNLSLAIKREEALLALAVQKITLAESVLADEAENYTYGKILLNDYIEAVNRLDDNRFNRILHEIRLKQLKVEWLRLTDRLVRDKEVLRQTV